MEQKDLEGKVIACENCNSIVDADSAFCGNCGARFLADASFPGKKGSGERFEACVRHFMNKPDFKPKKEGQSKEEAARAVCAYIGRQKYGKPGFQKMAAAGR